MRTEESTIIANAKTKPTPLKGHARGKRKMNAKLEVDAGMEKVGGDRDNYAEI